MTDQTPATSVAKNFGSPLCLVACAAAIVACAFSVLLSILMVSSLLDVRASSPLDRPELDRLRAALQANAGDVQAQRAIRDLDVVARRAYFGGLASLRVGGCLLLSTLAVALLSLKMVAVCRRRPADPRRYPPADDPLAAAAVVRFTLAATGVAVLVGAAALGLKTRLGAAAAPPPAGAAAALSPSAASPDTAASPSPPQSAEPRAGAKAEPGTWPGFRGPAGRGVCSYTNLPLAWDGQSGAGVKWKVPVPLPGRSSPIVWGNRVFLTGATRDKREVYCYDIATGKLLWQSAVDAGAVGNVDVMEDTGHAASTPVTDGTNVYAVFANGDVAALGFCAEKRWSVNLGLPANRYGFASSPVICGHMLVIQFDNNAEQGGKSELIALDKAGGAEIWRVERPVADSWPSPVVIETGTSTQLITAANEWIIAYDSGAGAERWRFACHGSDTAPSPLFAGGLVIAPVANDQVYALRPDRQGEVAQDGAAWTSSDGVNDVPSPVAHGGLVFLLRVGGTIACLEVNSGKKIWDHELGEEFYASPVIAGDRLYLTARSGAVLILRAGPKHEELGRAGLGEPSDCTPAFAPGMIIMRGASSLFCIGG